MLAAIRITGKPALSQAFLRGLVTIIVPFPAGGPVDTIGRIIAERMRTFLGQPVLIENVGGAAGSIGVGRAARAASDGYTSAGQLGDACGQQRDLSAQFRRADRLRSGIVDRDTA
jgi:tripartite-type tricarboxylate transporter receptor subunit TctC